MRIHSPSINWSESIGGRPIPLIAYEPDPDSSHDNFYYNTTQNKLYRLETAKNTRDNITKKTWIQIIC